MLSSMQFPAHEQSDILLGNLQPPLHDQSALSVNTSLSNWSSYSPYHPLTAFAESDDKLYQPGTVEPLMLVAGNRHIAPDSLQFSPENSAPSFTMSPASDNTFSPFDATPMYPQPSPVVQPDNMLVQQMHAPSQQSTDFTNFHSSIGLWMQHSSLETSIASLSATHIVSTAEHPGQQSAHEFAAYPAAGDSELAVSLSAPAAPSIAYPKTPPKPAAKDTHHRKLAGDKPAGRRRRATACGKPACVAVAGHVGQKDAERMANAPRKRKTLTDDEKRRLYTWLVKNIDHPYPSDEARMNELCIKTVEKQAFKWWFSNHRHRSLEQFTDEDGNKRFKAKLPFYKACFRLNIEIPWDIPQDIQVMLKPSRR
ncbi:hypothetical protein IWW50_000494 [Coemansia erecta]|nr:hypothetical protein IWW50_000494 [Coemansia erecta]